MVAKEEEEEKEKGEEVKEEKEEDKEKEEQVAQGRYVDSDTRCPALHGCNSEQEKAGQRPRRRQSPVEPRGTFVCPSVHPSFSPPEICPLRPEI